MYRLSHTLNHKCRLTLELHKSTQLGQYEGQISQEHHHLPKYVVTKQITNMTNSCTLTL